MAKTRFKGGVEVMSAHPTEGEQPIDPVQDLTELKAFMAAAVANGNTLWVDGKRTDEYTESGTIFRPYKKVQSAIDAGVSGKTVMIASGTYTEDLTLKAGVDLCSVLESAMLGTLIYGKATYAVSGGSTRLAGLHFRNLNGHAFEFSGDGSQKIQMFNCKLSTISSGEHHALIAINTHADSEISMRNCLLAVADSSGGGKCIHTAVTSKGSIGIENTSIRLEDDTDNLAITLTGAISYWHRMDEVRGQTEVASTAACSFFMVSLRCSTVACVVTNSAGLTLLGSTTITTTAGPAVTGAGAFAYSFISYGSTGKGFAATLNGGAGPAIGALQAENAANLIYDNTVSGLTAISVQAAIDELRALIP